MKTRRTFIKQIGLGTALVGLSPLQAFSTNAKKPIKLTILHTNDMHSHIEAFSSGRNKGLGGMFQLSSLVKKIRQEDRSDYKKAGKVQESSNNVFFFKLARKKLTFVFLYQFEVSCAGYHPFLFSFSFQLSIFYP